MPKRIQRKRTYGWRMPENAVYIGRGSYWGNEFVVGKDGTAEQCIRKYFDARMPYTHMPPGSTMANLYMSQAFLESLEALRGKDLACWCKEGKPCHGDIILQLLYGK